MPINDEILLSVIVPVYNAEKYLERCVETLLQQDLSEKNYQIILVDDGSKDNSVKILEKYGALPQVQVIHKANGGVSSARNAGLNIAKGKWIAFVDADDFILPNTYGKIIEHMQKEGLERAIFGFQRFQEESEIQPISALTYKKLDRVLSSPNVFSSILPRDIIESHNIRFNEKMKYGEDTLFMYYICLYLHAEKQCIVNEPVYCYRQHSQSVMHQKTKQSGEQHKADMLIMAETYQSMLQNFEQKDPRYKETYARQDKAVTAVMFDFARNNTESPKTILTQLREKKLYPIHFQWWTLKVRNRTLLYNIICFLFPIPIYYYAFTFIIRKLHKKG